MRIKTFFEVDIEELQLIENRIGKEMKLQMDIFSLINKMDKTEPIVQKQMIYLNNTFK